MIRSRVYLPKLKPPPQTILEHLIQRFPHIDEPTWRDRLARGLVKTADGTELNEDSPYKHGAMVFYSREISSEPMPQEAETILYQDDGILIADKPRGMTVTPIGNYVVRSLLHRLQERTGIEGLTPVHRLDKDTAGLVMFTTKRELRGDYHALFASNTVRREYVAAARLSDVPNQSCWHIENRIERGEPWFRQKIVQGPVNAITDIQLMETNDRIGVFRLEPQTGKKHQLRLHMASIGFPILGDALYPEIRPDRSPDEPFQLLARSLSFVDPRTRDRRSFESQRRLTA